MYRLKVTNKKKDMMFKKCVTIIVAVLFCAITMHAQEQLNLNLVGETRSYLAMLPLVMMNFWFHMQSKRKTK